MDGLRLLRDVTGAEVDQSMGAVSFLMSFFSQAPAFIIIFIIERAITGTRLPGQSPPQKKFDLSGVQHQLGGQDGWQDGRKCFQANQLLRSETKAHSCQNRYTSRVEQANTLLPDDGKAQSNYSSHLAECRSRFSISHGCILSEGEGVSLAMT